MRKIIFTLLFTLLLSPAFSQTKPGKAKVVKPRYHKTWYKNHIYKKKWRVGRIKVEPEKQGVKRVKMKG
jgi:hypothetical protein